MITQDPLKRSILTDGLILEVGGLLCKEDYLVMEKGGFLLPVFPREARGSRIYKEFLRIRMVPTKTESRVSLQNSNCNDNREAARPSKVMFIIFPAEKSNAVSLHKKKQPCR